ncbi:hypothetical protein BC567DRAFT_287936, partial [Phyllosticta citribraziliensis]
RLNRVGRKGDGRRSNGCRGWRAVEKTNREAEEEEKVGVGGAGGLPVTVVQPTEAATKYNNRASPRGWLGRQLGSSLVFQVGDGDAAVRLGVVFPRWRLAAGNRVRLRGPMAPTDLTPRRARPPHHTHTPAHQAQHSSIDLTALSPPPMSCRSYITQCAPLPLAPSPRSTRLPACFCALFRCPASRLVVASSKRDRMRTMTTTTKAP